LQKKQMEKFKNKVALITGGTNGMGLATAEEFIRNGAKVIITGRSQTHLDAALEQLGPGSFGILSDAGNMRDVMSLREKTATFSAEIDFLFLNAGYGKFAPIEGVTESFFDELFNVHVKGPFFTVQQMLPAIRRGGAVIFNASTVTGFGFQNFTTYSAAKAAVQSFVKTMAAECTARGIRVNAVTPGNISTNIFSNTGLTQEQIDGYIAQTNTQIPLGRFGFASEIAKAVTFLASEDASYIQGTEIVVDGGYLRLL
jgi:NAD(P)-dependent dehydrogenase (short-subunit alcohol dehydrogenase family)